MCCHPCVSSEQRLLCGGHTHQSCSARTLVSPILHEKCVLDTSGLLACHWLQRSRLSLKHQCFLLPSTSKPIGTSVCMSHSVSVCGKATTKSTCLDVLSFNGIRFRNSLMVSHPTMVGVHVSQQFTPCLCLPPWTFRRAFHLHTLFVDIWRFLQNVQMSGNAGWS